MTTSGSLPAHPDAFRPDGEEGGGTLFQCLLCGCRFTHGGRVCGSCPMATGCELVRCPNCGYQFPRSSRIADAFRRLWDYLRKTA